MPKMKTHKGAAKRFRLTAGGKIKRAMAGHSHLLSKKEMKRKRRLRKGSFVDSTFVKKVKRMLGK